MRLWWVLLHKIWHDLEERHDGICNHEDGDYNNLCFIEVEMSFFGFSMFEVWMGLLHIIYNIG